MQEISQSMAQGPTYQRYYTESLFLLGIEIGQQHRLTTKERQVYRRTFSTAQFMLAQRNPDGKSPEEKQVIQEGMENLIANWLEREADFRETFENVIGFPVCEIPVLPLFTTPARYRLEKIIRNLARMSGEVLSEEEVQRIVEGLEHPLNRA